MTRHLIVLFCVYTIFSAFSYRMKAEFLDSDKIKPVILFINFPVISGKGELTNLLDSVNIYYQDNFVVYRLPTSKTSNNIQVDRTGKQVGNKVSSEAIFNYFVHCKNDSVGNYYDEKFNKVYTRYYVKDFLTKWCSYNPAMFETSNCKKVSVQMGSQGYSQIVKYVPSYKNDESECDSLIYYYSLNKSTPLTFFNKPDKKGYLIKARFLYNTGYSKTYNTKLPKREVRFELKQGASASAIETKSIAQLIALFAKDKNQWVKK